MGNTDAKKFQGELVRGSVSMPQPLAQWSGQPAGCGALFTTRQRLPELSPAGGLFLAGIVPGPSDGTVQSPGKALTRLCALHVCVLGRGTWTPALRPRLPLILALALWSPPFRLSVCQGPVWPGLCLAVRGPSQAPFLLSFFLCFYLFLGRG